MFKRRKAIAGLEIDPSAVRAVTVDSGGHVDSVAERRLEPGIVSDGGVTDVVGLATTLRELFGEEKLPTRVRVGIASQRVLVRPMELPVIEKEAELEVAVRFHAQDALPMPIDGAVLDTVRLGIVETPDGPRTRVMLVAARKDMIAEVLAAVRAAGLRPEAIDLAGFAMVRSLVAQVPGDEPTLYVCVGGLTNVAIARGSTCVFTRVVGQGLEALSTELAERRGCARADAYDAVMEHGLLGDSEVAAVVGGGLRRLAAEVRTTIDFQAASSVDAPVQRCILTGPAVDVPGLLDGLAQDLGMPVGVGTLDGEGGARYATAAGLCLTEAA